MTWSRSSIALSSALVFGLVSQTAIASDPVRKSHSPIPTSVAQKLHGVSKSKQAAIEHKINDFSHAFIQNKGQWRSDAKFHAQTPGVDTWVTGKGITFDFYKKATRNGRKGYLGQVVKMEFSGANANAMVSGVGELASKENFFLRKPSKPQAAGRFTSTLTQNLYPGIDLKSYFAGKDVRYDLIVKPGADPKKIEMSFAGASSVESKGAKLLLGTQLGQIAQGSLYAYQGSGQSRVRVPASFKVQNGKVSFDLGAYDTSKPLVIDPVVYGSYLGGLSGWSEVRAVVSDSAGNVYVTGTTQANDYPTTAGPYFTTLKGAQNCFLTQLQGDAYNINYSVLFGGSDVDTPQYIQLDPYGNIWIAGNTTSDDFPGNTKGIGVTSASNPDLFVIRFQKSNSLVLDPITNPAALVVGGSGTELLQGFAVVPVPNAPANGPTTFMLAGQPGQAMPEVPGAFDSQGGFLLSYQFQDGVGFTQNVSQSFYIGDNHDFPVTLSGLATDAAGDAYLTGAVGVSGQTVDTSTGPVSFVTTAGVFSNTQNTVVAPAPRLLQGIDLFVRKYGPNGALIWSGLLGGADNEFAGGQDIDPEGNVYASGSCIAVDSVGSAYIVGISSSFNYPRTHGSFGETWADGLPHVVVTKVSGDGTAIIYSTNLRDTFNSGSINPSGIAVDGFGNTYVTGNLIPQPLVFPFPPGNPDSPTGYGGGTQPVIATGTTTTDAVLSGAWTFPNTPQITGMGCYLNVLNPTFSALRYGTYLAGTIDTKVFAPYVDKYSDLWVFGWTAGHRTYTVVGTTSTSPNPPYDDFSNLPGGMITSKAFKNTDTNDATQLLNWFFWDPNDAVNPGILPIAESRDGWLTKIRVGRPVVSSVNLGQTTLPGGLGASTTVSVTLSGPAPAEGAQVTLSVDNSTIASFSANSNVSSVTFTIPAGQTTSATVPIFSLPVLANTPVLVKGTYDGNFVVAGLNVVPWLQNFSLNPTSVVGGNSVTGTITLSFPAPATGVTVGISANSSLVIVPTSGTVTVPSGQATFSFSIGSTGVDSITGVSLTSTVLGVGKSAGLQLNPVSLQSIVVNPTSVSALGTISGTVNLTGAPGPSFPAVSVVVTDTAHNPLGTYVVTPSTLSFTGTSANFTISVPYEVAQSARLAVASMPSVGGTGYTAQSLSVPFTVDPTPLIGFTIDNVSPNPGDTINASVTLASTADQGGANVVLSSDTPSLIPIPVAGNPLSISAGSASGSVPLVVASTALLSATPVTITATRGSVSKQVVVTVQPTPISFTVTSISGNPITSILGGTNITGTLTLSAPAPAGGFTANLNCIPAGLAAPTTAISIPAGAVSVNFTIAVGQVASSTTLKMNVTLSDGVNLATSNLQTITVNASGLAAVSFIPSSVRGLHSTLCKVILTGPAPAGGVDITLNANNARLFPAPVVIHINAGQVYATKTIFVPGRVSRPIAVSWSASDPLGNLASALLTVLR